MQSLIRSFLALFLLGSFTLASAQLPPEVIADKYLVQAEQLLEKKDYIAALNMMDKSLALQKEHDLTLPDEFHFKYAQIAFSTGSFQTAIDAVSKYLSAGRGSEFYKEALALLIKIEEELEELKVPPENICGEKSVGSSCWMALTNQPDCYVWNAHLMNHEARDREPPKDETVTWSGECSGSFAQGAGKLLWNYSYNRYDDYWLQGKEESTGSLQNGRRYGKWVGSYPYGKWEGSYMHGRRHGHWFFHYGEPYSPAEEEGPYVDGKRHGHWVTRELDGREGGGAYVNGKQHGQWVDPYPSGQWEGSYVGGKRHGHWVWRGLDGTTETETYVHGHRQQ